MSSCKICIVYFTTCAMFFAFVLYYLLNVSCLYSNLMLNFLCTPSFVFFLFHIKCCYLAQKDVFSEVICVIYCGLYLCVMARLFNNFIIACNTKMLILLLLLKIVNLFNLCCQFLKILAFYCFC